MSIQVEHGEVIFDIREGDQGFKDKFGNQKVSVKLSTSRGEEAVYAKVGTDEELILRSLSRGQQVQFVRGKKGYIDGVVLPPGAGGPTASKHLAAEQEAARTPSKGKQSKELYQAAPKKLSGNDESGREKIRRNARAVVLCYLDVASEVAEALNMEVIPAELTPTTRDIASMAATAFISASRGQ